MEPEHRLIQERINKLKQLESWGVDIYPYRYDKKDDIKSILDRFPDLKPEHHTKKNAQIAGRIVSLRMMGKASFFNLQDESGKIQVYIRKEDIKDDYKVFKK